MDRAIKYSIIAGVLLISSAVFYYLVIFLPQTEQRKQEAEQTKLIQQKLEKETNKLEQNLENIKQEELLNACLDDAFNNYQGSWRAQEEGRGLPEGSSLPLTIADSLKDRHNRLKDDCFKRYS